MQRHIIISAISLVLVRPPIRYMEMHLNITDNTFPSDHQLRPTKIRPGEQVPGAEGANRQRPSVRQHRPRVIEIAAQPDLLHHTLGERERAIKPLHFRDVIDLVGHGCNFPVRLAPRTISIGELGNKPPGGEPKPRA